MTKKNCDTIWQVGIQTSSGRRPVTVPLLLDSVSRFACTELQKDNCEIVCPPEGDKQKVNPHEAEKEKVVALAQKDFGAVVFFYHFIADRRSAVDATVIVFVAFGKDQQKPFADGHCTPAFRAE